MSPREQIHNETGDDAMGTDETRGTSEDGQQFTQNGNKKTVAFGQVHIREYNRAIGDHPDTTTGPPITFGWEYCERSPLLVDTYEVEVRQARDSRNVQRLSGIVRKNLLIDVFGVAEEEVRSAEKEIQQIRAQRNRSKTDLAPMLTAHRKTSRSKLGRMCRRVSKNALQSLATSAKFMAPPMII